MLYERLVLRRKFSYIESPFDRNQYSTTRLLGAGQKAAITTENKINRTMPRRGLN
jgi:hypothetical protein